MNRSLRNLGVLVVCFVIVSAGVLYTPSLFGQSEESGFSIPVDTGQIVEPTGTSQVVSSKRLTEVVRNGGPLMIAIAVCSFILVMFTFERFISLRRGRCLLYTSPSPRDKRQSRMPSSA